MTPEIPTRQHEAGIRIPGYGNPYLLQIARLQEELEAMRQRAEAAEAALGMGDGWGVAVPPLSLQMTRIMRLLAARDMNPQTLFLTLEETYPNTTIGSLKVRLSTIRGMLPGHIAPFKRGGVGHAYTVKDRAGLREFLRTGVLPAQTRRAA
jgi:hypothetical protein